MDIDDSTIFTDALELHYINMKAFVKIINETNGIGKGETQETMLANWLAIITEKDIENKTIIKNICEEQEAISMAVSALARLSEDKVTRQAYQKRQDEIMLQNRKDRRLSELDWRLSELEATVAEKDAIIAELRSQLDKR